MAERTRKVRILDAPDYGDLTLELRYLGNKDMRASAQPMVEADDAEKQRMFLERFAQHCVKSWSAGEYSVTSGLSLFLKLQESDGTALAEIVNRAADVEAFKIPRLVDPVDLGNE